MLSRMFSLTISTYMSVFHAVFELCQLLDYGRYFAKIKCTFTVSGFEKHRKKWQHFWIVFVINRTVL